MRDVASKRQVPSSEEGRAEKHGHEDPDANSASVAGLQPSTSNLEGNGQLFQTTRSQTPSPAE
jgi:hypothetical protein